MNSSKDTHLTGLYTPDSQLVAAGRDRRPGAPLNSPPVLASNFVLGTERAYARDDGTPTWEALEEIAGLLEGGNLSRSLPGWRASPRCSTNCMPARISCFRRIVTKALPVSPNWGCRRASGALAASRIASQTGAQACARTGCAGKDDTLDRRKW
jgi:hypothetical protein